MKSNTLSYPSRTRRRDPAFHQPSVCSLNVPSPLQPQAFAPAVPSTRNILTQSLAAPRHSSLNSNVASSNDTRTPPAKGAWCSPPTSHPSPHLHFLYNVLTIQITAHHLSFPHLTVSSLKAVTTCSCSLRFPQIPALCLAHGRASGNTY